MAKPARWLTDGVMSDTPGTAEGHGTDLNVPMDSTDKAAAGGVLAATFGELG